MPLDERMESGPVAGRGASYEVRISRRAIAAVHCQEYDANWVETVDRGPQVGDRRSVSGLSVSFVFFSYVCPVSDVRPPASNLRPVYCLDAFVTFQLF